MDKLFCNVRVSLFVHRGAGEPAGHRRGRGAEGEAGERLEASQEGRLQQGREEDRGRE